jgi:glycosyltransferase involved in cell wall biosynthesis
MKSPFFSIILPTYNRASFISKAIESVIDQLYNKWELIILDDGSTDNTKEIVLSFNDDRIRYIYQENKERSAARNNGIRNAKGEYICFLDSDDY